MSEQRGAAPPAAGSPADAENAALRARLALYELVRRHIHCGYWEDPAAADGSPQDFARAGNEMCRRYFRAAGLAEGQRVLDAGCGTGGTLASANQMFRRMSLLGVNISRWELGQARRDLAPRSAGRGEGANAVALLAADASRLPLSGAVFDRILALESVMFFDRPRFFRDVARLLRPDGRLLVVDFLPAGVLRALLAVWDRSAGRLLALVYHQTNLRGSLAGYRRLAAESGLELELAEDWTAHTLPTYPAGTRMAKELFGNSLFARGARLGTAVTGWLARRGLLRYTVMRFRPAAAPDQAAPRAAPDQPAHRAAPDQAAPRAAPDQLAHRPAPDQPEAT